MVIIFDVVGTLFSLEAARRAMRQQKLPEELLECWFSRLLLAIMASSLAGRYLPFGEAAAASLRQLVAVHGFSEEAVPPVLAAMRLLEPWGDAGISLSALREQGHRLFALTNSSSEATAHLIVQAEMEDLFEAVISADEAGVCKPHPAAYRPALKRAGVKPAHACLVAAHGWDVLGAANAGMRTIWISRLEHKWPFPGEPPGETSADLAGVPEKIETVFQLTAFSDQQKQRLR